MAQEAQARGDMSYEAVKRLMLELLNINEILETILPDTQGIVFEYVWRLYCRNGHVDFDDIEAILKLVKLMPKGLEYEVAKTLLGAYLLESA